MQNMREKQSESGQMMDNLYNKKNTCEHVWIPRSPLSYEDDGVYIKYYCAECGAGKHINIDEEEEWPA